MTQDQSEAAAGGCKNELDRMCTCIRPRALTGYALFNVDNAHRVVGRTACQKAPRRRKRKASGRKGMGSQHCQARLRAYMSSKRTKGLR